LIYFFKFAYLRIFSVFFVSQIFESITYVGIGDLGYAERIIVKPNFIKVIPISNQQSKLILRIKNIRSELSYCRSSFISNELNSRLNSLCGCCAYIILGGANEIFRDYRKAKIMKNKSRFFSFLDGIIYGSTGYAFYVLSHLLLAASEYSYNRFTYQGLAYLNVSFVDSARCMNSLAENSTLVKSERIELHTGQLFSNSLSRSALTTSIAYSCCIAGSAIGFHIGIQTY